MAGRDPAFWSETDGAEFEADIAAVQLMAMPNDENERPTFHFDPHRVFDASDDDGERFDFTIDGDVDADPKDDVQVLCTIEETDTPANPTAVGTFAGVRLRLTFFATPWAAVSDFTSVTISDVDYHRVRRLPTTALFDVDLVTVEVEADDV